MGTLYENITSLCAEHGIKGGKMCVDLGISKSLMTKLRDNPARQITSETAKKIADYFGVSVERVLNGSPPPGEDKEALSFPAEGNEERAWAKQVIDQMDAVDFEPIAALLKHYADKYKTP